jgi:outer membrane protein assembly factor BamA
LILGEAYCGGIGKSYNGSEGHWFGNSDNFALPPLPIYAYLGSKLLPMMLRLYCFLAAACLLLSLRGQRFPLSLQLEGWEDKRLAGRVASCKDTASVRQLLDAWVAAQRSRGRCAFALDHAIYIGDSLRVAVFPGPVCWLDSFRIEGGNPLRLQQAGLDKVRAGALLDVPLLDTRLRRCLNLSQDEGYPFARFEPSPPRYTSRPGDTLGLSLVFRFEAGPLVRIDSIRIRGQIRESPEFVYGLIRLRPGDLFRQSAVDAIPRVLNNSIYYEKVPLAELSFLKGGGAVLSLSLSQRRSSRFDVLLGLLPPPAGSSQQFEFTGSADIALVSPLRLGEQLLFRYNKLVSTSRQAYLRLVLPYLLRSPVQLEGEFDLLKQEEAFLNVSYQAGGLYAFSPFLQARLFYQNRSTRLLDGALADTLRPSQLDTRRSALGAGLRFENLDYRANPSRGWSLQASLSGGSRRIIRNVRLPEALYDSLRMSQTSREVSFSAKWYRRLRGRHILHLALQQGWLGLDSYLRNDQWQLGGARSLRGFNENQFFADAFWIATLEYRIQLERDSYLFAFCDGAWLRDRFAGQQDWPLGAGLGMSYGTRAGILSVVYAVGSSGDIPFQPERGKIHIGFINQF